MEQILERLKTRHFPSKKMKEGVRVQVQFQDRRKESDVDRDVIVDRINRQTVRGRVVAKEASPILPIGETEKEGEKGEEKEEEEEKRITVKKIKKMKIPSTTAMEKESETEEPEIEEEHEVEVEEPAVEVEPEPVPEPGVKPRKNVRFTKTQRSAQGTPTPATEPLSALGSIARAKQTMPPSLSRMTPQEKLLMRTSPYYMGNRQRFLDKINQLFAPFMEELASKQMEISCGKLKSMGAAGDEVELLLHQRVAREYLNLYSPYRGLLLYFGLGSGKTAAAIAIAEGMKSHKRICVLTPASLKMNFFTELKRMGDPLYKKNQKWSFISIVGNPEMEAQLSEKLSLSLDYLRKKKGAWMASRPKPSSKKPDVLEKEGELEEGEVDEEEVEEVIVSPGNLSEPTGSSLGNGGGVPFSELTEEQQKSVDDQLNHMIRSKYTDINYNASNLKRVFAELTHQYTINPFDNSVVIIDEAHNVVNSIVNQLSKMPKKATGIKMAATTPVKLLLYELLMSASNARVVFLSGTPIINSPNEIAVMFNMLRGYIKTWTFTLQVTTTAKVTTETILKMFQKENFQTLDYVEYSQNKLTITRNPFGFINNTTGTCSRKGRSETETLTGFPERKRPSSSSSSISSIGAKTVAKSPAKTTRKNVPNVPSETESSSSLPKTKTDRTTKKITQKLSEIPARLSDTYPVPDTMMVDESDKGKYVNLPHEEYLEDREPHQGGGGGQGDDYVDPQYKGVCLDETGNIDDAKFVAKVKDILKRNGLQIIVTPKVEMNKCLPDKKDQFLDMFVEIETGTMKQSDLFARRILGLTSYFRSPQEGLLPKLVTTEQGESYELVKTEMSDYQLEKYATIRKEERDKEKDVQKSKKKQGAETDGPELYREFTSTYRIYSRSCCNFAWPDPPGRPITTTKRGAKSTKEGETEEEEKEETEKPTKQIPKSHARSKPNAPPPSSSINIIGKNEGEEEKEGEVEKEVEKRTMETIGNVEKEETEMETAKQIPKSPATSKTNAPPRPSSKNVLGTLSTIGEKEEEEEEEEVVPKTTTVVIPRKKTPKATTAKIAKEPKTPKATTRKVQKKPLKSEEEEETVVGGDGKNEEQDESEEVEEESEDAEGIMTNAQVIHAMEYINKEQYLSLANLPRYSPKFAAIMENIANEKHVGLHLLYSSFRTMEGIGILQLVLENNGFRRFELKKMSDGEWDILDDDEETIHAGKPKYVLYTGTETEEEKEIVRNIYNGAWDVVPPRIAKKLEERDTNGKKNTMGNVIKLLMITSSGAEGINLKNTRYVHIVEPYWNMVRVDQVVGRARRICSHEELPEELRTVKVFIYLSVFGEKQQMDQKYSDLMNNDTSRINENRPVTTDESLYEISFKKQQISQQILDVAKATSIDCALYDSMKGSGTVCFGANRAPATTNDYLSYPLLEQDAQIQTQTLTRKQTVSYRDVTIKGVKYHYNAATGMIYDHETFVAANRGQSEMAPYGKLVKEGKALKIQRMDVGHAYSEGRPKDVQRNMQSGGKTWTPLPTFAPNDMTGVVTSNPQLPQNVVENVGKMMDITNTMMTATKDGGMNVLNLFKN